MHGGLSENDKCICFGSSEIKKYIFFGLGENKECLSFVRIGELSVGTDAWLSG